MEMLARTDLPPMTADEFTEWSLPMEGRWELIAGVPIRMQSESNFHSRTSRRIAVLLDELLKDSRCTPDERVDVLCGESDIRQADILIDCATEAEETSMRSRAIHPIVVFEVAVTSASVDLGGKHLTYFRNRNVQHYVAILPQERRVAHFRRGNAEPIWLGEGEMLELHPEPGLAIEIDSFF